MNHTEPQPDHETPAGEDPQALRTFTACGTTVFDVSAAPDQKAALAAALSRAKDLDIILVAEADAKEAERQLYAAGRTRRNDNVLLALACHVPVGAPVNVERGRHAGQVALMAGRRLGDDERYWVLIRGHGPGLVMTGDFQVITEEPVDTHAQELSDICEPPGAQAARVAAGDEDFPALIDPDAPKPGDPPEKHFEHLRLLKQILDDDTDDAESRTALLGKGAMTATLTLKTTPAGGVIVRNDPRIPVPTSRYYPEAAEALRWYGRSLRSSLRNGWTIYYDGAPAQG